MRGLALCDQPCRVRTTWKRYVAGRHPGVRLKTTSHALMLLLTIMLPVARLAAQGVLVAPTALVLTEARRSATVTLVNTSTTTSDVSLSLAFGYPETDSLGQMHLVLQDRPADSMPSAVSLLSVYPSRVRLPPGATRVIRVVANADLPTRHEHWARLVVTSRGVGAGVSHAAATHDTANDPSPSVALALEVRSILGVFYRPADASTALDASEPNVQLRDGQLHARITLMRRGSAAYVGTLRAVLRNDRGVAVQEAQVPLGVYYTLSPRVTFDLSRLPAGAYNVAWQAISERPDVPRALLTPGAPVTTNVPVRIP